MEKVMQTEYRIVNSHREPCGGDAIYTSLAAVASEVAWCNANHDEAVCCYHRIQMRMVGEWQTAEVSVDE